MLVQRPPIVVPSNMANSALGNAKYATDCRVTHLADQYPRGDHLFRRQLRRAMAFTAQDRAVQLFVGGVFDWRCPSEMMRINAPLVAPPASMGRLITALGRRAVSSGANQTTDGRSTIQAAVYDRVATGVARKRPSQAIVPDIRNGDFIYEAGSRAVVPQANGRVALSRPAVIVDATPPTSKVLLAAIFDGAYSFGSHALNLLSSAVVRTRRSASTLGGFALCTSSAGGVQ